MAKARKKQKATTGDQRGLLQRVLDAERGPVVSTTNQTCEYQDLAPLVSEERKRHMLYQRNGDKIVDAGATTVMRWQAHGALEPCHLAAIAHCLRLWEAAERNRVIIDLDHVRGGFGTGDGWAQQEALDDLARIKGYIPAAYWQTFENVVRFDEPGGFLGSRIAKVSERQIVRTRTIVQFTADIIAMKETLSY